MVLGNLKVNERYACRLNRPQRNAFENGLDLLKLCLSFYFVYCMLDLVSGNQNGGLYQQRIGKRQ